MNINHFPPKPDLYLAIPGDKVKHNFDPGIFIVLECDPNQGIITVIPEIALEGIGQVAGTVFLPHPRVYSVGELRYADH